MIAPEREFLPASWDELIPILGNEPGPLRESFVRAVGAVSQARREGYINDDQAAVLLGEMTAVLVGAKLEDIFLRAFTPRMVTDSRPVRWRR